MVEITSMGAVRVIRLNRPEKRNAMTPAMLEQLRDALASAEADAEVRVVVVSGRGEVFCAGFDLAMCEADAGVLESLLKLLAACIDLMKSGRKAVVLSAHGAAVAGASALAAAADFVVTNEESRMGYPVVRLGISPAVSAPVLGQAIGWGAARARLLDPETVSGREAVRLGLACEAAPTAAACEARALELAAMLAGKPPEALAATKRWLATVAPVEGGGAALGASLALVGNEESRRLLAGALRSRR